MTKKELVQAVAQATGLQANQVNETISQTLLAIRSAVESGEEVTIRGFGTFKPKACKAKTARNISTGEAVRVPAHMKPSFKAAAEFVNETEKLAVV